MRLRSYLEDKLGIPITLDKQEIRKQVEAKILYYVNIDSRQPHLFTISDEYKLQRKRSKLRFYMNSDKYIHEKKMKMLENFTHGRTVNPINDYCTFDAVKKQMQGLFIAILNLSQNRSVYRLVKLCVQLCVIAIKEELAFFMKSTLLLFGWVFLELYEHELSIFMFDKCRIVATFLKNDLIKGEAMLGLAINLQKIYKNEESVKCLKRSLMYLWRIKSLHSQSLEIEVYQQLSLNFLGLGDQQTSAYFRTRYQHGTLESKNSNIIKLSHDVLTVYERRIIACKKLDAQIKVFLDIDFLHIQSLLEKEEYKYQYLQPKQLTKKLFHLELEPYIQHLFKDVEFNENIPLPLHGSNQKLLQRIGDHIEKRNKTKFIAPDTIRSKSVGQIIRLPQTARPVSRNIHSQQKQQTKRGLTKSIKGRTRIKFISRKKIQSHLKIYEKHIQESR